MSSAITTAAETTQRTRPSLRRYGTNTPAAVMRLVAIAGIVERKLGDNRARFVARVAARLEVPPTVVLSIVDDYAADVMRVQEYERAFFCGDPALPRVLVQTALDEIEGKETRLKVAQLMADVLLADRPNTRQDAIFVETAVLYWGIAELWRRRAPVRG